MEKHQRNLITKNLPDLINLTTCETQFLSHLIASDVLGEDDLENLICILKPSDRTLRFYMIIQKRANSFEKLLTALQATKQSGAASILLQNTSTSIETLIGSINLPVQTTDTRKRSICFDVRPPVQLFTGRSLEVLDLHNKILQSKATNPTVVSQIASVTGLGGIGKTELCRRYIQDYKDNYDGNVIWINAEIEDVIASTFERLSKDKLGIPTKNANGEDKNIQTIVDDVYEYFKGSKSLFVFDNAESSPYLQKYLPLHITEKPYILITSRDRYWKFTVGVLELNVLTEQDAVDFVKTGLEINGDSQNEEVIMLVNTLQNFPLAMQQAVSFIKERKILENYDITKYLKAFKTHSKKVLDFERPESELNDYTKTTYTAWKMTTVSISLEPKGGQLAKKILSMLSYFAADKIPKQIFSNTSTHGEDDWRDALKLLIRYSMINIHHEEETISIHRLVQEVNRIELRRHDNEEKIIKETLALIEAGLNDKSVNHLMIAFDYACKHPNLIVEFSLLPWKIVDELRLNNRLSDARRFGKKAVSDLERLNITRSHINMIRLQLVNGIVDFYLYRYKECLPVFEDVLKRYKRIQPFICPESLEIEYYVGATLNELGKRKTALNILEKVNITKKIQYGRSDWYVVNGIAQIYTYMQKYDDALKLFQEALKLCKAHESERRMDYSILTITQNMATAYRCAGKSDKAISLLQNIYDKLENSHDDKTEHTVAIIGNNLAACLIAKGNYEESKRIADKVYEKMESFYGPDSIPTLRVLITLGILKCFEENYEEALSYYNRVFEQFRLQLGEFHPTTVLVQCLVVFLMSRAGQEKAHAVRQEISQKIKKLSGLCKSNVGGIGGTTADTSEFLRMCKETLDLLKQADPKQELNTLLGNLLRITEQISTVMDRTEKRK